MRLTAVLSGLALSLLAGAAMACPTPDRCGGDRYGPSAHERHDDDARYGGAPAHDDAYAYDDRYEDRYEDERYVDDGYPDAPATWADQRGLYIHGHRGEPCGCAAPPPPCNCEGMRLSSSFFDGAGGVGPIPDGGYYGGGYYYVGGGSGASSYAFSSASARASASVSVRYRGGGHYHPHRGHKGGGGKRH